MLENGLSSAWCLGLRFLLECLISVGDPVLEVGQGRHVQTLFRCLRRLVIRHGVVYNGGGAHGGWCVWCRNSSSVIGSFKGWCFLFLWVCRFRIFLATSVVLEAATAMGVFITVHPVCMSCSACGNGTTCSYSMHTYCRVVVTLLPYLLYCTGGLMVKKTYFDFY